MPTYTKPQLSGIRRRFTTLYQELLRIAARRLRRRTRLGITPSDLTHEAYIKMTREEVRRRARDRSELGDKPTSAFKACFGATCGDVIADHVRRGRARKRVCNSRQMPFSETLSVGDARARDHMIALEVEEALVALAVHDPVGAQITKLRVLNGLTIAECASRLVLPKRSIDRKYKFGRTWLYSRMR